MMGFENRTRKQVHPSESQNREIEAMGLKYMRRKFPFQWHSRSRELNQTRQFLSTSKTHIITHMRIHYRTDKKNGQLWWILMKNNLYWSLFAGRNLNALRMLELTDLIWQRNLTQGFRFSGHDPLLCIQALILSWSLIDTEYEVYHIYQTSITGR
jgi:hypothetical protein